MNDAKLLQAENDVLGFLIHDHNDTEKWRICEQLELSSFHHPTSQDVYSKCVQAFVSAGRIDESMLLMTLKGDSAVLLAKLEQRDTLASIRYKVSEMVARSKMQRLYQAVSKIKQDIEAEADEDHFQNVENFIFQEYKNARSVEPFSDTIDNVIAKAETLKEGETFGFDWVKTIPSLRLKTGGIEPGKLYVIGATKKSGKSRFAVAIMKRLIEQGQTPMFLSMEMPKEEVGKLFLSAFSGISTGQFMRRMLPVELAGLRESKERFVDKFILDTDSNLTLEKIRAKCWRASQRGCSAVFIDYLQRVQFPDSRGKNYASIIAETVSRIADTARDYKLAIVLLSQLRNEAEKEAFADMRFLKDSGGIAEAADAIITINNRQRQEKGEKKYTGYGQIEVWFTLEQRSGETALIKTNAQLGRLEFLEQAHNSEEVTTAFQQFKDDEPERQSF